MALLSRIAQNDTIAEFEQAWKARLHEARALRKARRSYWGVYTTGYVIEMILKAACYYSLGFDNNANLSPIINKKEARQLSGKLGIKKPQNLHDLLFWVELLVAQRDLIGYSLPIAFTNQLTSGIQKTAKNWREVMRYRRPVSASKEYQQVYTCAEWLIRHYSIMTTL